MLYLSVKDTIIQRKIPDVSPRKTFLNKVSLTETARDAEVESGHTTANNTFSLKQTSNHIFKVQKQRH